MGAARWPVGLVGGVVLALALGGCTEDPAEPEPTPASSSPASPSASPSVEESLDLVVYGDRLRVRTYQEIVDAFEAENDGVDVDVTSYSDADTAAEAALVGLGSEWETDVFLADYRHLAALVETRQLEPVDILLEERGLQFGDDFQRNALTAFAANGHLQCMPAEVSPLVVYFNKRFVRRADLAEEDIALPGPADDAWEWEEFVQTAQLAVAQSDGSVDGVYLPPDPDLLTALIRSAGGDVVDDVFDPTSLTLTSDEAVETLTAVASLAREPELTPTEKEIAERDARQRFVDGDLAMYVGTRDDLRQLRAKPQLRFGAAPLPSFGTSQSVATMNAFCLDARSPQLDAAADFIAFAVGPEGAELAARSGAIVPSNIGILSDEVFTEPDEQPRFGRVYGISVKRSDPLPYSPDWTQVADVVAEVLARLWSRSGPIEEEAVEARMVRLDDASELLFGESD